MNSNITKLIRKEELAVSTVSFYFEKPLGFLYQAGQYCDWKLKTVPKSLVETGVRSFSLASSPHEPYLMITTRIRRSAFKNTLNGMKIGQEIEIEGPKGNFVLHSNSAVPAIFLAGGIGITPFRSIVLDAVHRQLPHQIILFYSNRRVEDTPFLNELASINNPHFMFIPTMTQMEKSTKVWTGHRGYINADILRKFIPNIKTPVYYIGGPPAMVESLRHMLLDLGIKTESLRTEEFTGY